MNNLKKYIDRIKRIDRLIATRSTGTPKDLADKLQLSERTIYDYINVLKEDFNAPVKYNKTTKTYYYETNGRINLKWGKKI